MQPSGVPNRDRNPHGNDAIDAEVRLALVVESFDERLAGGGTMEEVGATPTDLGPDEAELVARALRSLGILDRCRRKGPAAVLSGQPNLAAIPYDVADDAPPIVGRFELLRELGRGGQGIVYLARDPFLRRNVALKMPRPEVLVTPEMRRRFLREGHAAAALSHANVLAVFEAGEVGPVCYLAQAYCSGPSLAAWRAGQTAPVDVRLAAELVAELADGVAHAHAKGVLHRDLKPSNVLLEPREGAGPLPFTPKLTDFGLAKVLEADAEHTNTGVPLGTPAYMPPEQARGESARLGPASDVYGLGAILYELLIGEPPYRGASQIEVMQKVIAEEPAPLRRLRRGVPRDLEAICLRCLEKQPARRYATAANLAEDLRRYLHGEPTLARPASPFERAVRWARRKPLAAALIVLSCVSLAAVLGILSWSNIRMSLAYQREVQANAKARAGELSARRRAYVGDMRNLSETWTSITPRQAKVVLDEYRPKPGEPDLRGFEWWLYHRLFFNDTLSRVVGVHAEGVLSISISSQQDIVATGGGDGAIRLWSARDGKPMRELRGHVGNVNCVAFSPDGSRLVSAADDKTVRVWDVATGQCLRAIPAHTDWVSCVLFLPDGETVVSGGADRTIAVWNAGSGEEKGRLVGHTDTVRCVAYHSATGTLFSAAEDATVRGWDLQRMAPSELAPPHKFGVPGGQWIRDLVIEPDQGSLCGASFGSSFIMWNLYPHRLGRIHRHAHRIDWTIRSMSMGGVPGDPVLALGQADGWIFLERRLVTVGRERTLRGHNSSVEAVAVPRDAATLWSGSSDGEVRLWRLEYSQGAIREIPRELPACTPAISHSGRRVAMVKSDNVVELFDFEDLRVVRRFPVAEDDVGQLCFAPDERRLAYIERGTTLRMFEVEGTSWELRLEEGSGVSCVAFSSDGHLLAVARKDEVVLVDIAARSIVRRLPHPDWAHAVVFRGQRELISSGEDGAIRIWDPATAKLLRTIQPEAKELWQMSLAPDGRLLAVRGYRQVVVVDLESSNIVASLPQRGERGNVLFLASGRTLLTDSGVANELQLWNALTWQEVGRLVGTSCVAASANGNRLVQVLPARSALLLLDATPSEK